MAEDYGHVTIQSGPRAGTTIQKGPPGGSRTITGNANEDQQLRDSEESEARVANQSTNKQNGYP
jgi:hypothetical protein